jgi:putative transposase
MAAAGAGYFVTCVTHQRCSGLAQPAIWKLFLKQIKNSQADIYAAVLIPDHLHLCFELPEGASLGEIIRTIKGPMTPTMRTCELGWQKNYFEHRLRQTEATEPYLRYMLSNPYRAGIITIPERWPYWS